MKKLLSGIFASGLITFGSLPIKADESAVIVKPGGAGHIIYSFNEATGAINHEKAFNGGGWTNFFTVDQKLFVIPTTGNDYMFMTLQVIFGVILGLVVHYLLFQAYR